MNKPSPLEFYSISTTHPPPHKQRRLPVPLLRELDRVKRCRTQPAGFNLTQGRVYLRRCKSRLCPFCCRLLLLRRRAQIEEFMCARFEAGSSVLFATLTMKHAVHEPLTDQVAALKSGWAHFAKKGVGRGRGIDFYVGVVEFGDKGSHAHMHLMIAHRQKYAVITAWIKRRWAASCSRIGRPGRQVAFREVNSPSAIRHAAKYMTATGSIPSQDSWAVNRLIERLELPRRWKGYFHSKSAAKSLGGGVGSWISVSDLDRILAGMCDDSGLLRVFATDYVRIARAFRRLENLSYASRIEQAGQEIAARLSSSQSV